MLFNCCHLRGLYLDYQPHSSRNNCIFVKDNLWSRKKMARFTESAVKREQKLVSSSKSWKLVYIANQEVLLIIHLLWSQLRACFVEVARTNNHSPPITTCCYKSSDCSLMILANATSAAIVLPDLYAICGPTCCQHASSTVDIDCGRRANFLLEDVIEVAPSEVSLKENVDHWGEQAAVSW